MPNTHQSTFTSTSGDIYVMECVFPEENTKDALKDIVDCLEHIGMFDGLANNKSHLKK